MFPRSRARITRFLDDEDMGGEAEDGDDNDDSDDDDDDDDERGDPNKDAHSKQVKLKAPNFKQLASDESDLDAVRGVPSKLPAPLLQPAKLEAGWSTPGPSCATQTTWDNRPSSKINRKPTTRTQPGPNLVMVR
jgi:hypothetical protein